MNRHGPVQLLGVGTSTVHIAYTPSDIHPTNPPFSPSIPQVFENVQAFATIKQSTGISDIAERASFYGGTGMSVL